MSRRLNPGRRSTYQTEEAVQTNRATSSAEANFKLLFPYLGGATDEQIVEILEAAASNKPNSRCWSLRARVPAAFVYNPRAPLSQRGSRQTPKYSTPMGEAYDEFKIDTLPKTPTTWVIGVSRR
jgi:hypothetical protein